MRKAISIGEQIYSIDTAKIIPRILEKKERKEMKILARNVVFSNPSTGWNAQINIFRFPNDSKIHWSFVSAKALRNTWDSVPSGSLNSFYDWVHTSVDDFVKHIRSCVA